MCPVCSVTYVPGCTRPRRSPFLVAPGGAGSFPLNSPAPAGTMAAVGRAATSSADVCFLDPPPGASMRENHGRDPHHARAARDAIPGGLEPGGFRRLGAGRYDV